MAATAEAADLLAGNQMRNLDNQVPNCVTAV
jgi:hypothetical protein